MTMGSSSQSGPVIIIKRVAATFGSQVLPLAVGLLLLPRIISGLGIERFGILSLAWIVLGFFTMFDLGIGRATTKMMAEAIVRGDADQIRKLFWTSMVLQAVFGCLCAAFVICLLPFSESFIKTSTAQVGKEAALSLGLAAVAIPVMQVSTCLRGCLEAAERFYWTGLVNATLSLLTFGIPTGALALGLDLPTIVLGLVISKLAGLLVLALLNGIALSELWATPCTELSLVHPIFRLAGWLTVSSAIAPVFQYLERIGLSAFVSVHSVGVYSAPCDMLSKLAILPASIMTVLFPVYTKQITHGNGLDPHMIGRPVKVITMLLAPPLLVAAALAQPLLSLWLGPQVSHQATRAVQILCVGVLINAIAFVPYTALTSLGHPSRKAWIDMAMLPVFAILCAVLVPLGGLTGAAIARVVLQSCDCLLLFVGLARVTGTPVRAFLSDTTRWTISGTAVAGVLLGSMLITQQWSVAVAATTSVTIALVLLWVYRSVGLDSQEIAVLRTMSRHIIGQRPAPEAG